MDMEEEGGVSLTDLFDNPDLHNMVSGGDKKRKKKSQELEDLKEEGDDEEDEDSYKRMLSIIDPSGASLSSNSKLTVEDLMGTLRDTTSFGGLKKKLEGLKAETPLLEPSSRIKRDRIDRQTNYEFTTKDVSKWVPLVKRNREAEQLRFPMNEPPRVTVTSAALVSTFEAENDFEKEVANILEESGMLEDKKIQEGEKLELRKLSPEEVKARTAQLAKLRSLMFHEEMKAKRISKIKSKMYHKIKNKNEQRKEQKMLERLEEIDPEQAEQMRQKQELKRAKERMTLKHKNKSKFARNVLRFGGHEQEESRDALNAQQAQAQDLRRKMNKISNDSDDDSSEDEIQLESSDEDSDVTPKQRQEKMKSKAVSLLNQEMDDEDAPPQKGLMALKFMQRAAEQKREEAKQQALSLLQELEGTGEVDDKEETEEKSEAASGRRTFAAQANKGKKGAKEITREERQKAEQKISALLANDELTFNLPNQQSQNWDQIIANDPQFKATSISLSTKINSKAQGKRPTAEPELDSDEEFALKIAELEKLDKSKKRKAAVMENDGAASASTHKKDNSDDTTAKGGEEAKNSKKKKQNTEITNGKPAVNPWIQPLTDKTNRKSKRKKTADALAAKGAPESDDSELDMQKTLGWEDAENEEESKGFHLYATATDEQKELIKRAFVSGAEEEEFDQEKQDLMDEDEPKPEPIIPGWGSWTGEGVKQRAKQEPKTQQKPKKPIDGIEKEKRKDAKLKKVIITEKRDKKAAKYQVVDVPYPFTSKEQYEQSLRHPLGREWNTTAVYQRLIQPEVVTKPGVVITPLKLLKNLPKKKADSIVSKLDPKPKAKRAPARF
eukprot:GILJ01012217.1.p1 GENE.GILJ01012217.1~~GILJ01012217.1.p1  ORF type:complete len:905 (-),score=233.95 GILJ01012217.1:34-2550(-)